MGWGRLARAGLAGALACLLSACWMSEKPLISEEDSATIPFAASYQGDGKDTPEVMVIAPAEGGGYELSNGKEDRVPARFLALGGDWYLMQGEGHSDEEGTPPFYLYQTVKRVGDDLYFYSPSCDEVLGKFKGLKRETAQGEVAEGDTAPVTCTFSRLDGLKAIAVEWIAKLGRGEIADEPEILRHMPAR